MNRPYKPQGTGYREILIVDDDAETRQLLAILFGSRGYATRAASCGEEALQQVQAGCTDLVVLDILMPGMDGWETYTRLRALTDVPVLFLTAVSSGESAAQALASGAGDYVRKPFHPAELLGRIEALLRNFSKPPAGALQYTSTARRPTVSAVIPTLNEAENLPLVLPYMPLDWVDEVILVDGRSADGTIEVARRLLPSIKVVLERRPGKGAALRSGYQAAAGEVILVMDADGSHDPREIPRFVHALMEGSDFAKGSRFTPGGGTTDMPRIRQLGNSTFVSLVNLLFNVHFTDLCYGFHAFWRYCLDAFNLEDVDGFEIDTALYLRVLRQKLKLIEVPSFEGHRFYGVGKLRTIPDGWRVLHTIAREWPKSMQRTTNDFYIGFRGEPQADVQVTPASRMGNILNTR